MKSASFIADVIKVGVSKVIIIGSGLLTSVVTARFIGPEGNGIIASLVVYPSLFMSIGSLGIRQSTTFYLGKGLFTEDQIKTAITQIWMLTTVVSLIVSYLLIRYFSNAGENLILVLLALAPIPFSLFNTYNSGIFLGMNDIKTFNRINWMPSVVVLLFTALLVMGLEMGIQGTMISAVVGPLFMFFMLMVKNDFIRFFSIKYEWIVIKEMLKLGAVYAISLFVINLNYRIDVVFLDKLSTPYELGIYSKGAGITQYLWHIPMLLSTVVFARSAGSKDNRLFSLKVAQLLRISFVFIGLASVILFNVSDRIITGMYGEGFKGSISVLKILLPGVFILTVFKVMNMDLAGKGKPWLSLKAMLPALFVNIGLNMILIPDFGANGASVASTVSYSVAGLIFMFVYCRNVEMSLKELLYYRIADFDFIFSRLKK
jgi:O-antigen/teichoic acid export membrane protein